MSSFFNFKEHFKFGMSSNKGRIYSTQVHHSLRIHIHNDNSDRFAVAQKSTARCWKANQSQSLLSNRFPCHLLSCYCDHTLQNAIWLDRLCSTHSNRFANLFYILQSRKAQIYATKNRQSFHFLFLFYFINLNLILKINFFSNFHR